MRSARGFGLIQLVLALFVVAILGAVLYRHVASTARTTETLREQRPLAGAKLAADHAILSTIRTALGQRFRLRPRRRPAPSAHRRPLALLTDVSLASRLHPAVPRRVRGESENGEAAMNKDEMEGKWEQAKGTAKEKIGEVTGDEQTEAEGEAQQAAGEVQETFGKARRKAGEAIEDTGEAIKGD